MAGRTAGTEWGHAPPGRRAGDGHTADACAQGWAEPQERGLHSGRASRRPPAPTAWQTPGCPSCNQGERVGKQLSLPSVPYAGKKMRFKGTKCPNKLMNPIQTEVSH